MFKAIKDNKIIAINETGEFPCLVYDEVIEDNQHEVTDFVMAENEFLLKTDEKAIAKQKDDVRAVRNQYLETYVDPKQLVIRWGTLSETEQSYLIEYRQYLLDYPSGELWWEKEPLTYEAWFVAHHPVVEEPSNE